MYHRGMNRTAILLVVLAGCRGRETTCSDALHHLEDHVRDMAGKSGDRAAGPEDKDALRPFVDFLVKRCTEDAWPDDAVQCFKNASSLSDFEKCEQHLSESQRTKLEKGDGMPRRRASSKVDIAKITVKRYAFEAYPMWSAEHPDKACPDRLADLNDYMKTNDTKDPWGQPYKSFCGPTLPPGAKGLAVLSLGEDAKEGTADDIKSWE
jgi:Type II secretion system (T2SS), protein G